MIGWITNYIAIKMLFRPYKEMNFLFFKIQGLIPKRRSEIAEKYSRYSSKRAYLFERYYNLFNIADELEENMGLIVDRILEEKLESGDNKKFPMLAMFLSDSRL